MSFRRSFLRSQPQGYPKPKPAEDTRYVYGWCTWHESVHKVGKTEPVDRRGHSISLPCCPHCGSMLMEVATEAQWWEEVRRFDQLHPGYEDVVRWGKGQCFPTPQDLFAAYNAATGKYFWLNPKKDEPNERA